ncbi:MAG: TetR/AcrR family transcriptional regulator [Hyphomonadaceae bacterium]|nr:TetR/AcrR family transcriptional regulator [Hyphomonadaceae bacterium]
MARTYTLKRRAESQAQTRRRIVEAAVELHSTIGPANTTVSMIAEKAGVQRHTFYKHFPDERSVLMACSSHSLERDPMPDAEAWLATADKGERLRVGLSAVYNWYARNESLIACVLRDAQTHELVREIMALRYGPSVGAWRDVLGAKLKHKQRAMLALALSYHTWRTLVREAGLKQADAVKAMAQAVAA